MIAAPAALRTSKRPGARWEVGVAARPAAGERVLGDGVVVLDQGRALLVALCDGVGHGAPAAAAARAFVQCVRELAAEPLPRILAGCHEALVGRRGAVALVARFDAAEARGEFVGGGNVVGRVVGPSGREVQLLAGRRGVLGSTFRKVDTVPFVFASGDVFVAHSDGVSSRARPALPAPAQRVADRILAEHGKSYDDASCLVVRAA